MKKVKSEVPNDSVSKAERVLEELKSWLVQSNMELDQMKSVEGEISGKETSECKRLKEKSSTLRMVLTKLTELERSL